MNIRETLLKPIDRDIDGVIKADDNRHLRTEVEEYVITREIHPDSNRDDVPRYQDTFVCGLRMVRTSIG